MTKAFAQEIQRRKSAAKLLPCPSCSSVGPCTNQLGQPTTFTHPERVRASDPLVRKILEVA